jgi:hypothetical protein
VSLQAPLKQADPAFFHIEPIGRAQAVAKDQNRALLTPSLGDAQQGGCKKADQQPARRCGNAV